MHKETKALQALTKTNPTTLTGIIRIQIDQKRHWQNIQNEYQQALRAHEELTQKIYNWKHTNNPTETDWQNEHNRLTELDQELQTFSRMT